MVVNRFPNIRKNCQQGSARRIQISLSKNARPVMVNLKRFKEKQIGSGKYSDALLCGNYLAGIKSV